MRGLAGWRARAAEPGVWLGAWQLSVVLLSLAALYHVFLALWASMSPPHVVRNIASLAPYWLVYTLILVNTGVCLWRRLGWLRQQLSDTPRAAQGAPDWQVHFPAGDALPAGDTPAAVRRLRQWGYRARPLPDGGGVVWGLRHRWAALGTYLFHGALGLIAAGFLATLALRDEASVWVAVGEEYTGQPEQVRSEAPPRPLSRGLPALRFGVRAIEPEFWRDQLLFTRLEAELERPGGGTLRTRINRPVWLGPATFLRLAGFGYAARYELTDRAGRVRDSAFVKLEVFPPGRRDWFRIQGLPHRFYVEVLPDFVLDGEQPRTRSLNLVHPAVHVRVLRGRADLGGGWLQPGQALEFEGLRLSFPELRYWGEFSIVRDPGALLLFCGFGVGLLGLLLELPGTRAEVRLQSAGPDGWTLSGWGGRPPRGVGGR